MQHRLGKTEPLQHAFGVFGNPLFRRVREPQQLQEIGNACVPAGSGHFEQRRIKFQ